jgi:hypothetical protein
MVHVVKAPIPADHFQDHHLLLKENEADARAHLRAFWANSSLGRPAVLASVRGQALPPAPPHPWDNLPAEERDWLPEVAAFGTDWWLSHATEKYMGESMPRAGGGVASCLGLPAVMAGATYHYNFTTGTAWIDPIPDLYSRPLPKFDPAQTRTAQYRACIQAILDNVKGRAFVNPPIVLDPLTTLSLLRTPEQLCYDLLDRPDDVHRWTDALTELTIDLYEWIYQLLLQSGHGESGAFFTLMTEGRMIAVQCDFAVMLSPAQFEEFVMPYLRKTTEYLDFSMYHLDGVCQMRFLDQLRSLPKLSGIQWNPQPQDGHPLQWIDAFREIRKRKLVLAVGAETVDEQVELARALGPDGLTLFLPQFDTVQQAEQAIQRIQQACS